jgi:hypothetical protein
MSAIPRGLDATAQKRSLVEEIKESLGREADLARCIQPYDPDEDEEALG